MCKTFRKSQKLNTYSVKMERKIPEHNFVYIMLVYLQKNLFDKQNTEIKVH